VIANPDDDVNLLRIINTPRRGIGKTAIIRLTELARKNHGSLWGALLRTRRAAAAREEGEHPLFGELPEQKAPGHDKGRADLEDFIDLIESFRAEILGAAGQKGWRLSQKVRALVDRIDYWSHLVAEFSKNEKTARWKFFNIESLIQSIETWESNPDNLEPTLYPYLNRISLITRDEADSPGEDAGKVNLMTIHASKGLEFPVVFIAGAEDGILPHARSLEEGDGNIEEERRLFYVAITRARDKLFITSCLRRRRLQNVIDCQPSPFLAEIPTHLVEYHEEDEALDSPAEAEDFFARIKSRFA
jgi:DNA helicase-2/ATP-dependent DNA helicase PcrA